MLRFDANGAAALPALRLPRMWHWSYMLLFSTAFVILLNIFGPHSSYDSNIREVEQASTARGPWSPVLWWQVERGARWFRIKVSGSHDNSSRDSLALALSGPFSASVYVNGALAGTKGRPALSAAEEIPGPIDASIPIGAFLRAGENEILLDVSSHIVYGGGFLFQNIAIAAASEDGRRNPRHYGVAMLLGGLLAAFSVFFAQAAARSPRSGYAWLAVAAAAAVIALAAEVARSFIDYPYPWHALRLLAIWTALLAAAAATAAFAAAHFGGKRRVIAIGAATALGAAFVATGADTKTALGVGSLLFAACVILVQVRGERRQAALILAALIAPWIGLAIARSSEFLDNSTYVLFTLVLIAATPRTRTRDEVPQAKSPVTTTAAGRELIIDEVGLSIGISEIRAIHAAGNYSEVEFMNGACKLVRVPLTAIAEKAPELVRTHRSHLVRLDGTERLRRGAARGHALVLGNGARVPVSRSYLCGMRKALAAQTTAGPEGPTRNDDGDLAQPPE